MHNKGGKKLVCVEGEWKMEEVAGEVGRAIRSKSSKILWALKRRVLGPRVKQTDFHYSRSFWVPCRSGL